MKQFLFIGAAVLLASAGSPAASAEQDERWSMLDRYCIRCHNDIEFRGNVSFEALDTADLGADPKTWEAIAKKVRTGMMPPREVSQPDSQQAHAFVASIEASLDERARLQPHPGAPVLHRLNRTEYANAIRDVLDLEIDVRSLLPTDDSAEGFDNIAQSLTLSPALLEGYLAASAKVAATAVGDPTIPEQAISYRAAFDQSQNSRVEGAPLGTMGGIAIDHYFPVDGEYLFQPQLYKNVLFLLKGTEFPHALEVTIDKQRVHLAHFGGYEDQKNIRLDADATDKAIHARLTFRTRVSAGPHRVAVNLIRKPLAQTAEVWRQFQNTTWHASEDKGVPHLDKLNIVGPYKVEGPGDTPSRRRIFICQPANGRAEPGCASNILTAVARRAWRRPVERSELAEILSFYQRGREGTTFDRGIQLAIRRIISGPEFVFRVEAEPSGVKPGAPYRISDIELASRLSFFLWSSVPDEELLSLAEKGRLHRPQILEAQVRRMLADPKAETLVTNFASQWLTLPKLKGTIPDVTLFPDFDNNLREAFIRETELLVDSIIREDRNVVDLLDADYTFVNERLANHYGIPGIYGNRFRRVPVTSEARRGLLGHGSIQTLTSVATRTSAVNRGKWVLANLLASEPPPPPPNVPALEKSAKSTPTTLREQLSAHRANPTCAACHNVMDPIGFALENFDAVGRWREQDAGLPIDASDVMFDGTHIAGTSGLRRFLLDNQELFVHAMVEKMLIFSLGRGLEYYDMPAVRRIVKDASAQNNRFSALVLGVVSSDPFQMRTAAEADAPVTAQNIAGSSTRRQLQPN